MAFAGRAEGESIGNLGPDAIEMAKALAVLTDADPGTTFELRAIAATEGVLPKATSALFTVAGQSAAVDWAIDRFWNGYTIYIGLNPVGPDLPLGPGRAVRADDVLRRRWLFLDIDPIRPAGFAADSATDEEKDAAEQLAGQVLVHLTAFGWPVPLRVDSGNGRYLLYRIDLPNDEDSHGLIRQVLTALDKRFSGPAGSVDTSVHDAPRIAKLPGGWARKGPNTADRPHRMCRLVEVPDTLTAVSREQLLQLADTSADPASPLPGNNGQTSRLSGTATAGAKSIPERAVAYLASCPPAISGQGGHDQTFAVARAIVWGFDLGADVGLDLLSRHYNPRCVPPWSEKELRHKVEEADQVPFDKPRGWLLTNQPQSEAKDEASQPPTTPSPAPAVIALEPYQPFPTVALPSPLKEYVWQASAALGCDPAFVALPVMAAAASAIGNTRTIYLKRGWEEPAVIWAAIIGESGTLKSPAHKKAVAHLFRRQKEYLQEHREEMREYKKEMREFTKNQKENKNPGPEPERPVLKRAICSDTTIEKLAEILDDNPRGILVARDELAGWLASFNRYKGGQGGTDLHNWLELSQAGTLINDRKTGEKTTIIVSPASVSVAGGIQPGVLARALTPEFLDAGLAARILLAMPVPPPKHWSEAEVAEDAEKAYHGILDTLLARDFDTDSHTLRLSDDAKTAWVAFYNVWAREQATTEGEMAAAFSKLEGYAARFALLHHVITHIARNESDRVLIERASVEAGTKLCWWFANEARRIYAMLAETKEERAVRKMLDFIRSRGGRITVRILQHSNHRKYPSAAHAETALNALTPVHGAWEDSPATTPKGGQLARYFKLHPTVAPTTTRTDSTAPDEEFLGDAPPLPATDAPTTTVHQYRAIPAENGGSVGTVRCQHNSEEAVSNAQHSPSEGTQPPEVLGANPEVLYTAPTPDVPPPVAPIDDDWKEF
jgi:hypothetical protein